MNIKESIPKSKGDAFFCYFCTSFDKAKAEFLPKM